MTNFKYLFALLVGAFLSIESNQQQISPEMFQCNLLCDTGYVVDFEICFCRKTASYDNERKIRSIDSALVSKLIRTNEFASSISSNNRCSHDDVWNGSACIPLNSLCPGGYHWNGHVCIIKSTTHTAALVPSAPNAECKYAKQADEVTTSKPEPLTVMPTYSTSPMCPFGYIWSGNKCIQNPPACPNGYYYSGNVCHLKPHQIQPTTTESSAHDVLPSISDTLWQNNINGNKWIQKPLGGSELRFISTPKIYTNIEMTQKSNRNENWTDEQVFSDDQKNQHTCCSIMSPRICRHISNSTHETQWQCYHNEYTQCSDFCTKSRIFLRPKKSSFIEPILIMPPPPPQLLRLIQNHVHREKNIGNQFYQFVLLTF